MKFPGSGLDNETRQGRTRHARLIEEFVSDSAGRQSSGVSGMCPVCTFDVGPSPYFSQVFILKPVKVLCFDTLLQVFILKVVTVRLLDSSKLPIEAGPLG